MALIDIPLNPLQYRFRKLTWREEVALVDKAAPGQDGRRTYLSAALSEVVSSLDKRRLPLSRAEESDTILAQVPFPILERL